MNTRTKAGKRIGYTAAASLLVIGMTYCSGSKNNTKAEKNEVECNILAKSPIFTEGAKQAAKDNNREMVPVDLPNSYKGAECSSEQALKIAGYNAEVEALKNSKGKPQPHNQRTQTVQSVYVQRNPAPLRTVATSQSSQVEIIKANADAQTQIINANARAQAAIIEANKNAAIELAAANKANQPVYDPCQEPAHVYTNGTYGTYGSQSGTSAQTTMCGSDADRLKQIQLAQQQQQLEQSRRAANIANAQQLIYAAGYLRATIIRH